MSETQHTESRPSRDGSPYSAAEDRLIKQEYRKWKEAGRNLYGADKVIVPLLATKFHRTERGLMAHISKMRKEGRL